MPQEKIIKSSRQSRDASSVQLFASLWHFLFLCCHFCCCLEHCQALQKQNLSLVKSVIEGTIHCKPGAAELLVQEVYSILTNKRYGWLGTSAATCHQKPIRLLKPGSIRLNSRHQSASQVKLVTQEDLMISVVMEANCRVKTVYCLGCHETLPKRILVWPSMLRQSPENLASMQEKKKIENSYWLPNNFICAYGRWHTALQRTLEVILRSKAPEKGKPLSLLFWFSKTLLRCLQIWFSALQIYHCYMRHTHDR